MDNEIIKDVAEKLPAYFTRKIAAEALAGLLCSRTLANLDAKRIGPGGELLKGKRVYRREEFLEWLRAYLEGSRASAKRKGNRNAR